MKLSQKLQEIIDYDSKNFASGFNSYLKPSFVESNEEEQSFVLQYDISPWQLNPRGELHGGIVSSVFDLSMGFGAVAACEDFSVATADLAINFIGRVESDDKILVKVTIQKAGKLLIRLRADALSKKTSKIVASAIGSFVPLKNPK